MAIDISDDAPILSIDLDDFIPDIIEEEVGEEDLLEEEESFGYLDDGAVAGLATRDVFLDEIKNIPEVKVGEKEVCEKFFGKKIC